MKKNICLSILLIAFCMAASQTAAQTEKRLPVIVELFTSEGCSTCPPADIFLQALVREQPIAGAEIIALSEHVDYWNQSGWTDPFSFAQFSRRQADYAVFFKQAETYTPQIVVDGTLEFVGNRMREGIKRITEAAKNPKGDVNLEIEKNEKNTVSLKVKISNLPKFSSGDKANVFFAVTENALTSNVTRGENSGRTLTHTAVTRYLNNIGGVPQEGKTLSADVALGKDWKRENLSVVAFIQEENSRRILAAAKISL